MDLKLKKQNASCTTITSRISVGETGRYRGPGRREIGHGALGERALKQVMPSKKNSHTQSVLVAEVLESNGSSSQASICASTMAINGGWSSN